MPKILINGQELKDNSCHLTPGITKLQLSVCGNEDTENGRYYGRIELIPTNLDNWSINGQQDILKWNVRFDQNCNPLKVAVTWLIILSVAAFLLWMIVFKPIVHPRFGNIQKTFMAPGMPPLIVKFKGARKVVISANPVQKQSGWNRFWTGKILYRIHPAFTNPITFKPSKGRRVLVLFQAGSYQVTPNPIPGIGAAKIVDIDKNLKIDVN